MLLPTQGLRERKQYAKRVIIWNHSFAVTDLLSDVKSCKMAVACKGKSIESEISQAEQYRCSVLVQCSDCYPLGPSQCRGVNVQGSSKHQVGMSASMTEQSVYMATMTETPNSNYGPTASVKGKVTWACCHGEFPIVQLVQIDRANNLTPLQKTCSELFQCCWLAFNVMDEHTLRSEQLLTSWHYQAENETGRLSH